ncbi:MAG: hypothetical protein ACTSPE_12815 [Candidatus Thorarchaeota archaeon]
MRKIELRSDTFTLPTDEMIEAIVRAHKEGRLGDESSKRRQHVSWAKKRRYS